MATQPRRKLNAGMIIDRMVEVISQNTVAVLAYIVALSVITVTVAYVSGSMLPQGDAISGINFRNILLSSALQLAVSLFTIVVLYVLTETMLRKAGYPVPDGARRYFRFIGMALMTSICSVLGLFIFVIPGLIFMARWSVSGAMFISGRKGAFEAMGASWNTTRGSEGSIILAMLIPLVFTAVSIAAGLARGTDLSILLLLIAAIASMVGGAIQVALGVAIYSLLPGDHQTAETFK
jgi:hypothetical protein